MSNYPSVNSLVCMLSSRDVYRPVLFSQNEVFCGPDCETAIRENRYHTIKTPAGVFDIQKIMEILPQDQKPEIVIIKADSTGRMLPSNLGSLTIPKVLICGDTHHLQRPVQTLVEYAKREPFDCVLSEHDRHHLHFFKAAGFARVYWLPALSSFLRRHEVQETWKYAVSFVGQVGKWHPFRRFVLSRINDAGIPITIAQASHEQAARIYSESLININCSLNGDLNLRFFEILGSGGFLLSDVLSRESGLDVLFSNQEHFVAYIDENDCIEKIKYYSAHEKEAKQIARKGFEHCWNNHNPEKKILQFFDCVFNNTVLPEYAIESDKRIAVTSPYSALQERISIYEFIQEIHLQTPYPEIAVLSGIDTAVLLDMSDLPRLSITIKSNSQYEKPHQQIMSLGNDRVLFRTEHEIGKSKKIWNAVVITEEDLLVKGVRNLLKTVPSENYILLSKNTAPAQKSDADFEKEFLQTGLIRQPGFGRIFSWKDTEALGELLLAEGKVTESFLIFKDLANRDKPDPRAIYNLGVISLTVKDYENAESLFRNTLQVDHSHTGALVQLAILLTVKNKPHKAVYHLERALSFTKDNTRIHNLLGECYERLGKHEEGLQAYAASLALDTAQTDIHKKVAALMKKVSENVQIRQKVRFKKRRILVINNLYPPQELGGYGRLLCDFTNILKHRGHEISVLTSDTPYLGDVPLQEQGIARTLELYGEWKNGVTRPFSMETAAAVVKKNIATVQKTLEVFRPEVCLFGNVDFVGSELIELLLQKEIPVLHHLGNPTPGYAAHGSPQKPIYRLATASGWLRQEIWRAGYGLDYVDVIYPGALVKEFHDPRPKDLDALHIAFAGIVLPYKGAHILINALLHLVNARIDFTVTIAGTTTNREFVDGLKQICRKAGIDEKVTFTGLLDREGLKGMFEKHNVLVFPSIVKEAFGITQVEAMAAGLTVVSSGTGGAGEIIEHEKSGLIFQSENPRSLAEELIKLTKGKEPWETMRKNGQKRAREKFDIERSVDRIEEVFDELERCKR